MYGISKVKSLFPGGLSGNPVATQFSLSKAELDIKK